MFDLPLSVRAIWALGSILWFQWAKGKLYLSYAASLHPVDYVTGQTTFDGDAIKQFYAAISETGTLDVYVKTQLIDFGFVLGFLGTGLFVFKPCRAFG